MQLVKFVNNKVWRVEDNGAISGVVEVPNAATVGFYEDPDDFYDALSVAVIGSRVGLKDINYVLVGDSMVQFSAIAGVLTETPGVAEYLPHDAEELGPLFAQQFGLNAVEVKHLLDNIGTSYQGECVLPIAGTARAIHCPVSPYPCDYVRVVVSGFEIAYWNSDEWGEAPAEVLGAILGAARGGRPPQS